MPDRDPAVEGPSGWNPRRIATHELHSTTSGDAAESRSRAAGDAVRPMIAAMVMASYPDTAFLAHAGLEITPELEAMSRQIVQGPVMQLMDEARRHHLRVAGHLPLAVDAAEASDLGMASFEHLRNLEFACSARGDSLRRARIAMLDSGLAQPGLAFDLAIIDFPDPNSFALGKLFTTRFYALLKARLAPDASVAVQCTSPLFA